MRKTLNFNHLECFFSLAETLSFSKTSQELKIAQPAVSKQIKALEEYYKTQLLLRTKQSVQLTTRGRELYEKLYPLYSEIAFRSEVFLNNKNELKGKLVIGCLGEVGERVFIHPINLFKKKHPKVVIEVRFLTGVQIVEGVKSGDIHLGIISNNIIQENIRSYEVLTEEIMLVTSSKNKVDKIQNLSELSFVKYRENDPLFEFYAQKVFPKSKRSKIDTQFMVNSHKSMIEALKKHDLYAVMPSLSISDELKKGTLVSVGPKVLKASLYMAYLDLDYQDQKSQAFSLFLRDYLKDKYKK